MNTLKTDIDDVLPHLALAHPEASILIDYLVKLSKKLEHDPRVASVMTVIEARDLIRLGRGHGIECFSCEQWAKVYKRSLSKNMTKCLLELIRTFAKKRTWIECRDLEEAGGDYAKLAHWGLIVFQNPREPHCRFSGPVMPTPEGIQFALSRIRAPSYKLMYNNDVVGESEKYIFINEVRNFDPKEICDVVRGAESLPWGQQ